jgi:CRP/FNR family transcriptional regulator, cyclic AMP receptor protein
MALEIVDTLRQTGLAEGLTQEELEELVPICRQRKFPENEEVFGEASEGNELYIICTGRVSIEVGLPNRPGRKSERLATATSGMIFGEISLVDGSPRSAGARTMEETSVLEIMSEDIRAVMDKHPRIGYVIMKNLATVLSARLRNTNIWLRNELIWSR